MADKKHITLVAGGTGGHMMPAEAVSRELVARGYTVDLITDKRGDAYENIMRSLPRTVLKTGHMSSVGILGKMQLAINLMKSYRQCKQLMRQKRPDVVVGFGGYPSVPAMKAAFSLKIPTVLHEQNAVLGRSNRLLLKKCDALALSFKPTRRLKEIYQHKAHHTGNPIRKEVVAVGLHPYPVPKADAPIHLLVIGGSQGARILSDVVPQSISLLPSALKARLVVTHQARPEDVERVKDIYAKAKISAKVAPFFEDMAQEFTLAHLVISRAGASSVTEIISAARPAIYIPLLSATDDHQTANAKTVTQEKAGWLLPENTLTMESLADTLQTIIADNALLATVSKKAVSQAKPDADKALADLITAQC